MTLGFSLQTEKCVAVDVKAEKASFEVVSTFVPTALGRILRQERRRENSRRAEVLRILARQYVAGSICLWNVFLALLAGPVDIDTCHMRVCDFEDYSHVAVSDALDGSQSLNNAHASMRLLYVQIHISIYIYTLVFTYAHV